MTKVSLVGDIDYTLKLETVKRQKKLFPEQIFESRWICTCGLYPLKTALREEKQQRWLSLKEVAKGKSFHSLVSDINFVTKNMLHLTS